MNEGAETEFDYIKSQARMEAHLKAQQALQAAKIESILDALRSAAVRLSDMADLADKGKPASPSFLRASARRCEVAIELYNEHSLREHT